MPDVTTVDDLLPDGARVEDGELVLGGVRASELAREFGTPVVVYDDETMRSQARAYRTAAPGALVAYGTKAFPSVAVLRLFAEEGLGADVSTAGELAYALGDGAAEHEPALLGELAAEEDARIAEGGREGEALRQLRVVAARLEPLHRRGRDRGFHDLPEASPVLDLLGQ